MILSKLCFKLERNGDPSKAGVVSGYAEASARTAGSVRDPLACRIVKNRSNDPADVSAETGKLGSTAVDASQLVKEVSTRIARAQSVGMDIEACLERITFREPATETEVLDCLRTFGVAIFPSIYNEAQLARITKEYDDLIENGAKIAWNEAARADTSTNSYGFAVKTKALRESRFPETDALHWGKQRALNSWLYVSDATEGCGAMRAGVGTTAWTRYIREDALFDGIPYKQIVNHLDEQRFPVVFTGGPAGTLFLFSTDTANSATLGDPGKCRNIMRARSRPHRANQWPSWVNNTAVAQH